jgi:hypothetical protein
LNQFLHSSHDPDFHRLKPPYDRFGYDIIGESLIQKDGKDWKDQRDILAPAFHHAKIKTLVSTFLELTHKARDIWIQKAEEGRQINVIPWVSSLTLDIIGKAGFGFDFGALDSKLSRVWLPLFPSSSFAPFSSFVSISLSLCLLSSLSPLLPLFPFHLLLTFSTSVFLVSRGV